MTGGPFAVDGAARPSAGHDASGTAWWARPLSPTQACLGWIAAAAVFVGWLAILGGPAHPDLGESLFATIAIAHGQFGCLFSLVHTSVPIVSSSSPSLAPLYPLITGTAEALLRTGHGTAFPLAAHGSNHCGLVYDAAYRWAQRSGALSTTLWLGALSWMALAGGLVAFLRTSTARRRGAELVAMAVVAAEPLVVSCLAVVFHPEYLLATGLGLAALGAARRLRWGWCGVLVSLAVLSQQGAVLVAAALLAVATGRRRRRFALSSLATLLIVAVPLAAATSGRSLGAVLYGSSMVRATGAPQASKGGTVLWELHLHGAVLFAVSRLLPIGVAGLVALWARRRLGPRVLEAPVLASLTAMAFAARLVFEVNLFGYYFMALSVALVALDVTRGRLRLGVVVWILMVTLAFNVVPPAFAARWAPWSRYSLDVVAAGTAIVLLVAIGRDMARRRSRVGLIATLVLVLVVFRAQIFAASTSLTSLPGWLWQLLLVPAGVALAASPLLERSRRTLPLVTLPGDAAHYGGPGVDVLRLAAQDLVPRSRFGHPG